MKRRFAIFTIILVLVLAACSVEISDSPSSSPTQPPAQSEPTDAPPPTDVPESTNGPEPTAVADDDTPVDDPEPTEPPPTEPPATLEPPAWADLNLNGSLVYIAFVNEQQNLLHLDLVTGRQTTLFDPPENAWLTDVAASPDGSQILMAYAAPPPEGEVQFGFTDLYTMPADGSSEPEPLLLRAQPSETYFNISWPVEDYIYYAHFAPSTDDLGATVYTPQVERLRLADGDVEVLAGTAAWPRVSPDGSLLAYVTDDNEFIVANADGSDPTLLLDAEFFPAVDAPLFSPDNSTIYFSAIEPEAGLAFSFWDWLFGVQVASAHTVPSDWWRMPIEGGEPERLTSIYEIGMYGDFGPDGRYIAFITTAGLQTMNPDGTGIFRLRNIAATGTLDWIP